MEAWTEVENMLELTTVFVFRIYQSVYGLHRIFIVIQLVIYFALSNLTFILAVLCCLASQPFCRSRDVITRSLAVNGVTRLGDTNQKH